jgi:hypothetical protein
MLLELLFDQAVGNYSITCLNLHDISAGQHLLEVIKRQGV